MSQHAERRAAPTLVANRGAGGNDPQSLVDLMYEGFYALSLLQNGSGPQDQAGFAEHMTRFLADVDRHAKPLGVHADDVHAAKYAFCAAVDEIILRSQYAIREAWETRPLQLRLFGDQLAGNTFAEAPYILWQHTPSEKTATSVVFDIIGSDYWLEDFKYADTYEASTHADEVEEAK